MVTQVVLVAVHGPKQIEFKPMRMAVIFNHLKMILHRIEILRRMRRRGHRRPDAQAEAEKPCQEPLPFRLFLDPHPVQNGYLFTSGFQRRIAFCPYRLD